MSLKSIWDRIRSVAAGATSFLISDDQREEAKERLRLREAWEAKRSTPRVSRRRYRIPNEVFYRTHFIPVVNRDEAGQKTPRLAQTYRAERRNARRTGRAGGMGNAIARGMY